MAIDILLQIFVGCGPVLPLYRAVRPDKDVNMSSSLVCADAKMLSSVCFSVLPKF